MKLTNGDVIPYGLCVWSTGVGPTPFISSLPFVKTSQGRLAVDNCLRVLANPEGECLPAVDQVQAHSPPDQTDNCTIAVVLVADV